MSPAPLAEYSLYTNQYDMEIEMRYNIKFTTPKGGKLNIQNQPKVNVKPEDMFVSFLFGCFSEEMNANSMIAKVKAVHHELKEKGVLDYDLETTTSPDQKSE